MKCRRCGEFTSIVDLICTVCGEDHNKEDERVAAVTPYEEVLELIGKMKDTKKTMEGTDLDYFEEQHLVQLIEMCKEVSLSANEILKDLQVK